MADQLLSLKVMRLSRPAFAQIDPPTFELGDSENTPPAAKVLQDNTTSDLLISEKDDPILRNHSLPDFLTLPASFGNIYLGETFSSYLCINNESNVAVQDVGIKAELQTSTQRFTLADTSSAADTRISLLPAQSAEFIIHHEIKELNTHILVCAVQYSVPTGSSAAGVPSPAPDRKFFRKFYKFQVLNPLAVKTKVNTLPDGRVFLEAQVQNIASSTMFLERMKFEPSDLFVYTDLTLLSSSPTLLDSSHNPPKSSDPPQTANHSAPSVLGPRSYLNPQDSRQYLYMLLPSPSKKFLARTTPTLGKLDIIWRTQLGQMGRLQTSQLSRKVPTVDPLELVALPMTLPMRAEKGFSVPVRVYNNMSNETARISIAGVKSKMSSVLLRGAAERYVGEVPPLGFTDITLDFFPLLAGLHKITGLKMVELNSGLTKEIDTLADVSIAQNELE
ncbi:hypothetical protein BJ742DRAFT_679287 [Cladochytrium replicatum]|nr:hypothetical protein BJ742DRAFT_679287 [Cladochytrium replicatum]